MCAERGVVGAVWQKGRAQCAPWLVLPLESCCSAEHEREGVGVTVEGYIARVCGRGTVRDGTPPVWCTCGVRRTRRRVWRKVAATPVAVCARMDTENGAGTRGRDRAGEAQSRGGSGRGAQPPRRPAERCGLASLMCSRQDDCLKLKVEAVAGETAKQAKRPRRLQCPTLAKYVGTQGRK